MDELLNHLQNCLKADAALIIDGNGDGTVASLLAAGWTQGSISYVGGKRIRLLSPPADQPLDEVDDSAKVEPTNHEEHQTWT